MCFLWWGVCVLAFGLGVVVEEKIDGDDVGALPGVIAMGGGLLTALAAYVDSRDRTSR